MPDMAAIISKRPGLVLSGLPPGAWQRRLAIAVAQGMFVVFVVVTVGALSGIRTTRIESLMPGCLTAMFVCESITAVLLFAQYSMLRQRATLVIGSGYTYSPQLS